MILSDKVYNLIKKIAQYILPAFGTLYSALAGIWGLPYAVEIVGTITAIDTFLGVFLGICSHNYKSNNKPDEGI